MGRCDEVGELIRDVLHPLFDPSESLCHPDEPCPRCGRALYGEFRLATEAEIQAAGLKPGQYEACR